MIDIVRCDYIHSSEYRGLVNAMAREEVPLSKGIWWLEQGVSIAGPVYYLYRDGSCLGDVRKEDASVGGVESAIWKLIKYLEGYMKDSKWSILVFPKNWSGTSWYAKSFEFVVMSGVRSKSIWETFMRQELLMY